MQFSLLTNRSPLTSSGTANVIIKPFCSQIRMKSTSYTIKFAVTKYHRVQWYLYHRKNELWQKSFINFASWRDRNLNQPSFTKVLKFDVFYQMFINKNSDVINYQLCKNNSIWNGICFRPGKTIFIVCAPQMAHFHQ